jgi:hypothetical protein
METIKAVEIKKFHINGHWHYAMELGSKHYLYLLCTRLLCISKIEGQMLNLLSYIALLQLSCQLALEKYIAFYV